MNRKRLSKLLGKELEYTAILGDFCKDKGRTILKDVRYDGKFYADHCWVARTLGLKKISINSKVKFKAEAFMYNDKFGIRKEGLKNATNFQKMPKHYDEQMEKEKHDAEYSQKRKWK